MLAGRETARVVDDDLLLVIEVVGGPVHQGVGYEVVVVRLV